MTGYGFKSIDLKNQFVEIEIKSLNSKFLDIQNQIPKELNSKEIDIINLIKKNLVRGKIYLSILIRNKKENQEIKINELVFKKNYEILKILSKSINNKYENDLFKITSNLKGVISSPHKTKNISYNKLLPHLKQVITKCNNDRKKEGILLEKDIYSNVKKIKFSLQSVIKLDQKTIAAKKKKIVNKLKVIDNKIDIDKNRLEQEIVYYIEKYDINEEVVRLKGHLISFLKNLNSKFDCGKKLTFISQEIGREINTIGSKSNDLMIQKNVVKMKYHLEKIKEQLFNVL